MHYFSTLFDKELDMFQIDLLYIIRSFNTVITAIGMFHTSYVACLQTVYTVNTVLRLLMMDSKSVRNISSSLPNKAEK